MNGQPNAPRIDVCCTGNPQDVGLAIGEALREKILCAQSSLLEIETFRQHQPWWMPSSVYQYMAQWRARALLEPSVQRAFPQMAARLQGIAEGAQTSLDFLYLFHAMESAPTAAYRSQPAIAACTAIAARGARTADGQPLIGHNFDLVDTASSLLSLRDSRCCGPLRFIGLTLAPLAGMVDGINEAGLAITYDYAPTTDIAEDGPPISLSIDHTLATCSTVSQAVDCLRSHPRGGGAMLMLADSSGEVAALELSAHHTRLRYPDADQMLTHSNAYQTPAMQRYELPRTAVYTDAAPQALRGTSVFESAEQRDRRLRSLLRDSKALNVDELARLLADHGEREEPSANTICMHGGYWSTLASIQLLPKERRLRVSYGPACSASFQDFAL